MVKFQPPVVKFQPQCIIFLLISTYLATFYSPTPLGEAGPIPFERAHNYIQNHCKIEVYPVFPLYSKAVACTWPRLPMTL